MTLMYLALEDLEYLWCDLGLVLNSSGNKAAANLHPTNIVSIS